MPASATVLSLPSPAARLLREAVYDALRAEIMSCTLAPGADIREAELAARFEVSKSPVRDALMRLEREGLVITLPRQGYRVAPISLVDVQDMFHLRSALEQACMARIAALASDVQLTQLDRFRVFTPAEWPGGFVAYNRAFHHSLAELASNLRLRNQLDGLIDEMERVVIVSVNSIKKGDTSSLVAEHCRMIDALQQRSVKRAERLAQQHIGAAAKRVGDAMARMVVPG